MKAVWLLRRGAAVPLLIASCSREPVPPSSALRMNPPTYVGWLAMAPPVRTESTAVHVVDLNQDGREEILTADVDSDRLDAMQMIAVTGGGYRLQAAEGVPLAERVRVPGSIDRSAPLYVADLDGDGRLDLVSQSKSFEPLESRVVVRWNLGDGFSAPQVIHRSSESSTREIAAVPVRGEGGLRSIVVLAGEGPDPRARIAQAFAAPPYMVDAVPFFDPGEAPGEPPRIIRVFADRRTERQDVALPDCMAQGVAVADFDRDGSQEVLLACDFGPQMALRVRATGEVALLPDFIPSHPGLPHLRLSGHGMGVAVADVDRDGYPDAAISTIGGFFDLRGGPRGLRLAPTALSGRARAYWPWGVVYVDLRNDGQQMLLSSAEFGLHDPLPDPSRYLTAGYGDRGDNRESYLAFIPADSPEEYRVGYTAWTDVDGVGVDGTTKITTLDVDNDGVLEVAVVVLRASDRERRFGELHIGRPVWSTPPGNGLTIRLYGAGVPFTRARLRCHGGEEREDRLFLAEGASGGRRHFLHIGCGDALSYDWLRLSDDAGRTVDLPGGPLQRALLCDPDQRACRELPRN